LLWGVRRRLASITTTNRRGVAVWLWKNCHRWLALAISGTPDHMGELNPRRQPGGMSLPWRTTSIFADDGRSISPNERFILATKKHVGRWLRWHRDGQSLPAPWGALGRYLLSFDWLRRSAIPQLRILRKAEESAPAESRRKHEKKPRHCSLPGLLSYMLRRRARGSQGWGV